MLQLARHHFDTYANKLLCSVELCCRKGCADAANSLLTLAQCGVSNNCSGLKFISIVKYLSISALFKYLLIEIHNWNMQESERKMILRFRKYRLF